MPPGRYIHFGLANGIIRSLEKYFEVAPDLVKFNVNMDGLPLAGSSGSCFWPICGSLVLDKIETEVFLIGVYHGFQKPEKSQDYLKYFVDDVNENLDNGVFYKEKQVLVQLNAVCCDAPARAFVACIKNHNGYCHV